MEKKKWRFTKLLSVLMLVTMLTACSGTDETTSAVPELTTVTEQTTQETVGSEEQEKQESESTSSDVAEVEAPVINLDDIPEFSGSPYVEINGNEPFFTDEDLTTEAFEYYSPLDELGRCGVAYANICNELMPTEERESIGMIKPTGWHTVKYDFVDGKYLYNRCHIIGFQLAGENANKLNLVTGTRYFNVTGMLPFENQVADYARYTGNHVLFRCTPIFKDDELVCRGLLMEARSVETDTIRFCVYIYNNEPGVQINYKTGESWADGTMSGSSTESTTTTQQATQSTTEQSNVSASAGQETAKAYVLNTNTHKFHIAGCRSINQIKEGNRSDVTTSRSDLIAQGYEPCKNCNP